MKKYKQFIIGVIVGAILFSFSPITATVDEFVCRRANYKVMVNGDEYISSDLPILNYNGNTYAPFRSILEKAGLNVVWNAELSQAEVTSNPTSVQNNNVEESTMLPKIKDYQVIEKDGFKLYVANGVEYIQVKDIYGKYGSDKYGFYFDKTSGSINTKFVSILEDKSKEVLFENINAVAIAGISSVDYNFFVEKAEPFYLSSDN